MRTKDSCVLLVAIFAEVSKDSSAVFEIKAYTQRKDDVSCVIYDKTLFSFSSYRRVLENYGDCSEIRNLGTVEYARDFTGLGEVRYVLKLCIINIFSQSNIFFFILTLSYYQIAEACVRFVYSVILHGVLVAHFRKRNWYVTHVFGPNMIQQSFD